MSKNSTTTLCSVKYCDKPANTKGLCQGHYKRLQSTGDIQPDVPLLDRTKPRESKPCVVDTCDRSALTRGWCEGHYRRWLATGDIEADRPLGTRVVAHRYAPDTPCMVDGCDRPVLAAWMCGTHYGRWQRLGDVKADMPIQPHDKSGSGTNHKGYVVVSVDGKQKRQHRVVMEQMLKRPLIKGENVHHINGIKDDNRPENLELWISAQPAGQRVEDLIAFAHEILDRYES